MSNASILSKGSPYRAKITGFIKIFGEEPWKMKNNYNLGWNAEIYFSRINRLLVDV
jgi:hypothetical protein